VKYLFFIFFFINSAQLINAQETNSFKIPRSYNHNSKKSYPAIYLTYALYSFQIVSGATRFPMNTGKMREAIIVGISYSKGSGDHASRVRDFTHIEDSNWKSIRAY
jgi:hypothetical protein